jgi:VanZ family protein
MREPSPAKNRKPLSYLFLGLYALFTLFFLVESCFPGDLSAAQSGGVGNALAWFLNLFEDTTSAVKVEPDKLTLSRDSSFLNLADPSLAKPALAQGTTTLLAYTVHYPDLGKNEYGDPSFNAQRSDNSTEKDYLLQIDGAAHNVRIISVGGLFENGAITVSAGPLTSSYAFSIVALPAPTHYEVSLGKSALKKGERTALDIRLVDPTGQGKDDYYLSRYYDKSLCALSCATSGVFAIDVTGGCLRVLPDAPAGNYSLTYAGGSLAVEVLADSVAVPAKDSLTITLAQSDAAASLAYMDYDYQNDKVGVMLEAAFAGDIPADPALSFYVDDPLKARITSVEGTSCQLKGYRAKGQVKVWAALQSNPAIVSSPLTLTIGEVQPTAMALSIETGSGKTELSTPLSFHKGQISTISGVFTSDVSVNVTNTNILAVSSDPSLIEVSGSGTPFVSLAYAGVGECDVVFQSQSNPALSQSVHFTLLAEQNQDPTDSGYQWTIRKAIGHFGWFFLTAIMGALFFHFFDEDPKKEFLSFLYVADAGFVTAALSEIIQLYVPGRGAAYQDILLDWSGALLGALLIWGIVALIRFLKKKKEGAAPSSKA